MPLRLEDNELLDVFDSGHDDEFDALNINERDWLKQLVKARDSGSTLARHRWEQAKSRKATLEAGQGLAPIAAPAPTPLTDFETAGAIDQARTPGMLLQPANAYVGTTPVPDPLRMDSAPYSKEEIAEPFLRGVSNIPSSAANLAVHAPMQIGYGMATQPFKTAGELAQYVGQVATSSGKAGLWKLGNDINPMLGAYLESKGVSPNEFVDMWAQDPVGVSGMLLGAAGGALKVGKKVGGGQPPPPSPPPAAPTIPRGNLPTPDPQFAATHFETALEGLRNQLEEGGAPGKIDPGKVGKPAGKGTHALQALLDEYQLVKPNLTRQQAKASLLTNREAALREIAYARAQDKVASLQQGFAHEEIPGRLAATTAEGVGSEPSVPINRPLGPFDTKRTKEFRDLTKRVDKYHQDRRPRPKGPVLGSVLGGAQDFLEKRSWPEQRKLVTDTVKLWRNAGVSFNRAHDMIAELKSSGRITGAQESAFLREVNNMYYPSTAGAPYVPILGQKGPYSPGSHNFSPRGFGEGFKWVSDKDMPITGEKAGTWLTIEEIGRNGLKVPHDSPALPIGPGGRILRPGEPEAALDTALSEQRKARPPIPSEPKGTDLGMGFGGAQKQFEKLVVKVGEYTFTAAGETPGGKGKPPIKFWVSDKPMPVTGNAAGSRLSEGEIKRNGLTPPGEEQGPSVGPLPEEPSGTDLGMGLGGAQRQLEKTWSNTAALLERLPESLKADSLLNWLAKESQRAGIPFTKAEQDALQLPQLVGQHRGKNLTKSDVRQWLADRVVRTEERTLGGYDARTVEALEQRLQPEFIPEGWGGAQGKNWVVWGPEIRAGQDSTQTIAYGIGSTHEAALKNARTFMEAHLQDDSKFNREDLRLPGGTNYREVMVKAPAAYEQTGAGLDTSPTSYRAGHFDPNTIAHMRLTDRTVKVGDKSHSTLFSEEFQSDWDNAARRAPDAPLPTHPLLGEWKETIFKRLLRKAAEEGKDAVAWTTGEQQAARYDLSKSVDSLSLQRTADDAGYAVVGLRDKTSVVSKRFASLDELSRIVGKEPAEKLIEKLNAADNPYDGVKIEGLDLAIGGKWTKDLYDRQMVDIANKWAKRFGGQVVEGTTKTGAGEASQKVHTLPLTAEMKRSLLNEGNPTFGFLAKEGNEPAIAELREVWSRLGHTLGSGPGEAAFEVLAALGARVADDIRGPVKGLRGSPLITSNAWAPRFLAAAKAVGHDLTQEQLQVIWNHPAVRLGRTGYLGGIPQSGRPQPRGAWVSYAREAGPGQGAVGEAVYNTVREITHRTHLAKRLVRETEEPLWKNVSREAETDMTLAIASTPDPHSPGAWLRFGTMPKAEAKAYIESTGSHILPDGLIIDDPRQSLRGVTQVYKLVKPDEAKSLMDKFVATHPKAVPTLERLMSEKAELAQLDQFGDSLPMHSFKNLRKQYRIIGLEEADRLNALGREIGVLEPTEQYPLGYVSELAQLRKPRSIYGRLRNFLSFATASVRRRKTGAGLRAVWSKQAEAKLAEGHRLSREGLMIEDIYNDGVTTILTLALEPVEATGPKPNFIPLTKRTFGETGRKWQRYIEQNQEVFDALGAHLEDGDVPTGKTRYQISRGQVENLRPLFADEFISIDPKTQAIHDNLYKAIDGLVSTVNTARLTAPSTQVSQSMKANSVFYAVRVLRDAYLPLAKLVTGGPEGRLAEAHNALTQANATIAAMPASLRPSVRGRIPLEALGETSAYDLTGGPPKLRTLQSIALTPMRAIDWASKWANTEASIDGAARIAWLRAKRSGSLPKGAERNAWIRQWKENVPAPIRALAAIESDTWGGFDYSNLNRGMAAMRGSGPGGPTSRWVGLAGRATIPYPIFQYKKFNNFYGQVAFAMRDMLKFDDPTKQAHALATLAAFYTAWKAADMIYEGTRPKDLPTKDDEIPTQEKDLSYPLRKAMRLPLEDMWANVADIPILGEAAYYRELERGGVGSEQVMNSQIGYGILPQALNIMMGMSDPFQPKEQSIPGKLGSMLATMVPGSPEAYAIRKVVDPFRRDVVGFKDPAGVAFKKALANHYPIASSYLPPLVGPNKTFPQYDRNEVGLSFLYGNITLPDEASRAMAIQAARVAIMEKTDKEFNEDEIRRVLLPTITASGDTASSPLLRAVKEVELRYGVARLKMALDMKRAYVKGDRDMKTAIDIMLKAIERADPNDMKKLKKYGQELLVKLEKSENLDQFTLDFAEAPPEVQAEFIDDLNPQGLPQ